MTQSVRIDRFLTMGQLRSKLHFIEKAEGRIVGLTHSEDGEPHTVAIVAGDPVPMFSLELVRDPSGRAAAADGRVLLFHGIVYVQGRLQRVAAFRRDADSVDEWGPSRRMVRPSAGAGRARPIQRSARGRNPGAGVGFARKAVRHHATKASPRAAVADKPKRAAAARPSASTRPPASARPVRDPVPKLEPREYRVWFGTNRKPVDPDRIAMGFSAERDDKVHYGHCDVYVPESHKMGSIGSSLLIRLLKGSDDRLKLRRVAELARAQFWTGVGRQIESAAPGARHAVVFIHGYRVSFRTAALRTAQIGMDLGIQGAMAFFSWPSKGTLRGYFADGNSIEGSEAAIADFLIDFTRRSGAEAVHVIAHSMGNRGLLRAANRIVAAAAKRGGGKFGQIILAAPDVDAGSFRDLAAAYRKLAERTTLYVSSKDLAVQLARWISDYARVGFHPPVTVVDGIDTVSVTNLDLTLLGHGYVAEAREVLGDMESLISGNKPPPRFGQTEKRTPEGRRYWEVRA